MAFMRYAYTQADGSTHDGALSFAPTVVVNGDQWSIPVRVSVPGQQRAGQPPPCSDIHGNAGFGATRLGCAPGWERVKPGCYAFCTGANDKVDGDYARDVAVVPTEKVLEIPQGAKSGTRRADGLGDNSSDATVMERERARWALTPEGEGTCGHGSQTRPAGSPRAGGKADVEISGGVGGCRFGPGYGAGEASSRHPGGRRWEPGVGAGAPDEPWYNAWPDAGGMCGFTSCEDAEGGGPVRLSIRQ